INPKDRRPFLIMAYVYGSQTRFKEASEAVAKAIKIDPTDKEVYFLKAQYDKLREAYPEALAALRKAIELDPKYADAHLLLGQILEHDDSQAAKAIAAYQTALSINPALYKAHEGLGKLFDYQMRKTEDKKYQVTAEEHFRQSIALDPKHQAGRFDLGRIMVE